MSPIIPAALLSVAPGLFSNLYVTPKLLGIAACLLFLKPSRPPAFNAALVFLGAVLLSAEFSLDPWTALAGQYRCPYYGILAVTMVFLAYCGSPGYSYFRWLLPASAVLGYVAVAQVLTGSSLLGPALVAGNRAGSLIGSPVFLGTCLIPGFIVAWDQSRKSDSVYFLGCIVIGLVCAQSKGAYLGCAAAVMSYELRGRARRVGIGALLACLAGYVILSHSPNQRERLELLRISWMSFRDHPWLGWGPDQFAFAFQAHHTAEYIAIVGKPEFGQASAHEDIAQIAVTLGLVGLSAYIYLLWSLVRSVIDRPVALGALVGVWFAAQVNPVPIEAQVVLAVILGSSGGAGRTVPRWVMALPLFLVIPLAMADYHALRGKDGDISQLRSAALWSPDIEHLAQLQTAYILSGKPGLAIAVERRAMRIHPNDPRSAYLRDSVQQVQRPSAISP